MPIVGHGIPVQRTSSVLATKGSFKRNKKGHGTPENDNQQDQYSSNTSLRDKNG